MHCLLTVALCFVSLSVFAQSSNPATVDHTTGTNRPAIDYQNPPLPEPPPDPFTELPVINQITNPPAPGKAFQPCSVHARGQGDPVGPTGPPVHTGGTQIQPETRQTVIFDPSVSEPSIDTTTDSWLANCGDSVENEEADETVPAGFASQVDQSPEPAIDPLKIPPPPAPAFCGGNSTSGKETSGKDSIGRLARGPVTCLGGPPAPKTCANANDGGVAPCALDCNLPFCGRDVILVHGYRLGPLGDWYTNDSNGALTIWPDNAAAFKPGGYWFEGAMDYWEDYIVNKLAAGYTKNSPSRRMPRVLTIAYPVSQRIPIAASAMLSQISDAINCTACPNTNVYTVLRGGSTPVELNSTNDTRHGAPFCMLGCVIVSHSTGGPVTNLAMYYAHTSGGTGSPQPCNPGVAATSQWVRISDCYVKAHVAIEPAFSGSNHATELFAASLAVLSSPVVACPAFLVALDRFTHTGGITFTGGPTACLKAALTGATNTTDLLPVVMVRTWQPLMKQSPVPTLIVATSHPVSYWPLMWGTLFPGFPDNTLTMDSQLGRPPIELTPPYLARPYVWVQSRRFLLDRANNGRWPVFFSSRKAFGYYVEQTNLFKTALRPLLPPQVSAAANQYLTPTGMHIPLTGGGNIPANSVGAGMGPTTYTFLQASASHFWRWRFGDPAFNLAQDKPQSTWDNTDPRRCVYNGGPPVERGYNYEPIGGKNTDFARSLDEESRAVFDKSLYSHTNQTPSSWDGTGGLGADGIPLVSERMQNAVEGETVISNWPEWKLPFGITVGGGIHWQRTYYRLKNWECEDFLDYINDFAVRR